MFEDVISFLSLITVYLSRKQSYAPFEQYKREQLK